ncbi:hypothetical protein AX17_001261 [Amanita inopinata Kibby_2008]|nr:hypothetical protein AX17_001261 [Amanita inopinata Kibby_2008]
MVKSLSKIIYKPDTQSTDEFIVIVNSPQYRKWKAGDTTIPLADVVDSFAVFHSGQGSQGLLGKPSNQQLDTVFGSTKDIDVVTTILAKGREQASEGIQSSTFNSTNPTRGSAVIDSRGRGSTGI